MNMPHYEGEDVVRYVDNLKYELGRARISILACGQAVREYAEALRAMGVPGIDEPLAKLNGILSAVDMTAINEMIPDVAAAGDTSNAKGSEFTHSELGQDLIAFVSKAAWWEIDGYGVSCRYCMKGVKHRAGDQSAIIHSGDCLYIRSKAISK